GKFGRPLVTGPCRNRVKSGIDTFAGNGRSDTTEESIPSHSRSELPMHPLRLLVSLAATALLLTAPVARGASPSLVVSQVYAGGGNAGATFTNDFVELFNRGSSAADVSGWTVQYASASSTSWQVTPLSGSVQPGHY